MAYQERIGRSKLSVVRDGFRFLFTILFSACCYAPIKTMLGSSVLVGLAWGLVSWLLLRAGGAPIISVIMMVTAAMLVTVLLGTGMVVHQLNFLMIGPRRRETWVGDAWGGAFSNKLRAMVSDRIGGERFRRGGADVGIAGQFLGALACAF